MGGISTPACVTVYWRGRKVCKHSVAKLEAWAKSTGADVYVKPIQGCYSTAVSASANTHAGGGVYDVEMDGYTLTQANTVTSLGRKAMLITELRWWKNADGSSNHHIHLIDPACPDMDPSAAEQVEQYRRGETGLVGTADKDVWYRGNSAAMLREFDTRFSVPAPVAPVTAAKTYTIPSGGTLAKAAAVLGATVAAVAAFNGISNPDVVHPGQVVTKPPAGYSAPAIVRPTVKPSVSVSKPTVRPTPTRVTPRPVAPVRRPLSVVVKRSALKPGKTNASVRAYERALARRGYLAWRYVDGYYGTATKAGTNRLYRHYRWTPWATVPGPGLLRALHVKFVR